MSEGIVKPSQELKQPTQIIVTDKNVEHTINEHAAFKQLLTVMCKRSGLVNTIDTYTMDYDGHNVENTKPDDATFTNKPRDITL